MTASISLEDQLLKLIQDGGLLGAVVAVAVLGLGLYLRSKGLLFGGRDEGIAKLTTQFSALSDRVGQIERDMLLLPTREEIHALQLGHARMAEQLLAMDRTATSTARAVERIENFMIEVSQHSGRRGKP